MRTTYKRCRRCKQQRPSSAMWGHDKKLCRVCGKESRARHVGRHDVAELIRAYGDLDGPLTDALGVQWAYTLVKATQGTYARV